LRIEVQVENGLQIHCFNPCFNGSCSRILYENEILTDESMFQSLF